MSLKHLDIINELLEDRGIEVDEYEESKLTDFHWKNTVAFIGEEEAKKAFNDGKYTMKEARAIGKSLGLALCYGGSAYTVKRSYPTYSDAKCQRMVDNYFKAYPVLKKHLEENIQDMRRTGYITNLFGREIPVWGWDAQRNGKDYKTYYKAEADASNYPIQSAGGEIVRIMIVRGNRWAEEGNLHKLMGNNCTKHMTERIVVFKSEDKERLHKILEEQETGNTKILICDGDEVVGEYDRNIQFSPAMYKEFEFEMVL